MTQSDNHGRAGEIERLPSGVLGLDTILNGGFLRGGLYMIQGAPGLGKTILASQIVYHAATAKNRGLFVTVLGENHARMMAHLRPLGFFDEAAVPEYVSYISGYQALEAEGLKGLSAVMRREVVAHGAKLLVLDDVSAIEAKADARFEMKRFTHELQTLASVTDCTIFMLTTVAEPLSNVESSMVDGLIELKQGVYGSRAERRLKVQKLRGSNFLEGEHAFRITNEGISVFPRIETLSAPVFTAQAVQKRKSLGVVSLDTMFGGGLPDSTIAMMLGAPGAGKTTLGLHFLSGASADEPGLFFGCYEPLVQLRRKAASMGIDFEAAEANGTLEIIWQPVGEYILDELAGQLLTAVRQRQVKRLVIDGMQIFKAAAVEPERLDRFFWAALTNELRALGVTTLLTLELQELIGPELRIPVSGIPSLCEVVILVRHVERQFELRRLISLLKVREGAFDPAIREFKISAAGIVVGNVFSDSVDATPPPPYLGGEDN